MSRSNYSDDIDNWGLIRWRGAVKSAIRGKRGQAFLGELLTALDSMSNKRLIAEELEQDGEVCALGSVGKLRGMDMSQLDPGEPYEVAEAFGIPYSLACEIVYVNDEWVRRADPEKRFQTVRKWVVEHLANSKQDGGPGPGSPSATEK